MSSASCASDFSAWLVERVATARIAALCLLLAAVAWGAASETLFWTVAVPIVLLVIQFRLWDDLAERAHDAFHHPARVAVRTAHASCFAALAAVLAVVVAVLLAVTRDGMVLGAYGALLAAAAVFYKKSVVAIRHPWRTYAILLKYPVFVALCAGPAAPLRIAAASVAVFGVLAAFETLDDAVLRAASGRGFRAAGFVLLAVAGIATMVIS